MPSADPARVRAEIEDLIGISAENCPLISAKEGVGIEEVLEEIVKKVPPPRGSADKPLKALIFDSQYDNYKGAVCFIRVVDGSVKAGDKIKMMSTDKVYEVTETGIFSPKLTPCKVLQAGDVGYLCAAIKTVKDTRVGDTITNASSPCDGPLPGYKKVNPMVFCGIYPADGAKYQELKDALEKLNLNDAALVFEPDISNARASAQVRVSGLLHMEIIQRLERELIYR